MSRLKYKMNNYIYPKKRIFFLAFVVVFGVVIHTYWLDGIGGAFYEIAFGNTVYSPGYREYKFKRIRNGMSEKDVVNILGQPLRKNPFYPNVWFYSFGKNLIKEDFSKNDNYTERIIKFKDGQVIVIHHGFYFD